MGQSVLWARMFLAASFLDAFGPSLGTRVVVRSAAGKALGAPEIAVPVPGTSRSVLLRTNSSDFDVFAQVFARREYDFTQFPQGRRLLERIAGREGARVLIIDGGANIGLTSIWFKTVLPTARIVAVEPDRESYRMLLRNLADLQGCSPMEAGLWGVPGTLTLVNPEAEPWERSFAEGRAEPGGPEAAGVPAVTLGGLVASNRPFDFLIVKLDVEGAEGNIFAHDKGWLDEADLVIVETHDRLRPGEGIARSVLGELAARSFDLLICGDNIVAFKN